MSFFTFSTLIHNARSLWSFECSRAYLRFCVAPLAKSQYNATLVSRGDHPPWGFGTAMFMGRQTGMFKTDEVHSMPLFGMSNKCPITGFVCNRHLLKG